MVLTIRQYETERDLLSQYDFWEKVTVHLPYAWKPTRSPSVFQQHKDFDPRARLFAFDGEQLVGHISFSGSKEFISFGYPWVIDGYEGELQEILFERLYHFAISDSYNGKLFAQRFRAQWKNQLSFFEQKGFDIVSRSEIYGGQLTDLPSVIGDEALVAVIENNFEEAVFEKTSRLSRRFTDESVAMLKDYYPSLDFDFSIKVKKGSLIVGYFSVALRQDTGFAEILVAVYEDGNEAAFVTGITMAFEKLRTMNAKTVGIQLSLCETPAVTYRLKLKKLTEDIMVMKSLGSNK